VRRPWLVKIMRVWPVVERVRSLRGIEGWSHFHSVGEVACRFPEGVVMRVESWEE
jgi:hypothetical protein